MYTKEVYPCKPFFPPTYFLLAPHCFRKKIILWVKSTFSQIGNIHFRAESWGRYKNCFSLLLTLQDEIFGLHGINVIHLKDKDATEFINQPSKNVLQ